ncbi:MAG TPA: GNAT family N-acetyltransferase [Bacillota bacterium]|nr:GNAT family N-acetyltransferase [Bacillota bacterium]
MRFKILQSDGPDKAEWQNLIGKLNQEEQDIHFLPEYGNIYRRSYGYEPFLAYYGDDDCFMIQVFVKRPLNELPFLKEQSITEPLYDVTNPYGYGGPVCRCNSADERWQLLKEYNFRLVEYLDQNKIASEFTCFHPLLYNHQHSAGSGLVEVNYQKEVVYLDLTKSEAELWFELTHSHKSNINKARKLKVRVEKRDLCPANFAIFENLYYRTMIRHNASAKWFFPDNYFWNYYLCLGPTRISLFFASVDQTPASAVLLMHDFSTIYYHFCGSDDQYYALNPNSLLLFEVALWAKENGFRSLHLGGGVTSSPTDSLLRFKAGFSKHRAQLYSYQRILNEEVYRYLCSLKKQHERKIGDENDSDYFPLYRR